MNLIGLPNKDISHSSLLLLSIPLTLSAFTHLWNPIGFPSVFIDEVTYIQRALHVLEGLGPENPSVGNYDHPYFGQLFLAGVLTLVDYPNSVLNPYISSSSSFTSPNNIRNSIEMLY